MINGKTNQEGNDRTSKQHKALTAPSGVSAPCPCFLRTVRLEAQLEIEDLLQGVRNDGVISIALQPSAGPQKHCSFTSSSTVPRSAACRISILGATIMVLARYLLLRYLDPGALHGSSCTERAWVGLENRLSFRGDGVRGDVLGAQKEDGHVPQRFWDTPKLRKLRLIGNMHIANTYIYIYTHTLFACVYIDMCIYYIHRNRATYIYIYTYRSLQIRQREPTQTNRDH